MIYQTKALASPLLIPLISMLITDTLTYFCYLQKISPMPLLLYFFLLLSAIIFHRQTSLKIALILSTLLSIQMIHIFEKQKQFESLLGPPVIAYGQVTDVAYEEGQRMPFVTHLALKKLNNNKLNEQRNIIIYTRKKPDIAVSDTICIDSLPIKMPNSSDDYYIFLLKNNISASAFIPTLNPQKIYRPEISFSRIIFNTKQKLLLEFQKKLSPRSFIFFSKLFLGKRSTKNSLEQKINNQAKRWGALHYLARSGLHLVIVLSLYEALLKLIPLPFTLKQLLLLLLSLCYLLLSWTSLSFLRAFYSFVLLKSYMLLKKDTLFIHILTLTCTGMLLYNPFLLFSLDFQLSFGLTFALSWLKHYSIQ